MVPLIKLYTIAFWKKYLEGDGRYMRYLTPGYANRNDLEAFGRDRVTRSPCRLSSPPFLGLTQRYIVGQRWSPCLPPGNGGH